MAQPAGPPATGGEKPNRSFEGAIWLTLALVVAILLGARFGYVGLLLGAILAAVAFMGFWKSTVDPEIESLKASLRVARDDIAQIIAEYDDIIAGATTDAIADRTLNYPALTDSRSDVPEIEEFQLRLGSSRRFVGRVDKHLLAGDLDRHSLERLITIADQRAAELAESWSDARRAARRLGPAG